jgi:hypothetical protein
LKNSFILTGDSEEGIRVASKPSRPLIALVQAHEDRLRALLDKPVVLGVNWDDGDSEAVVTVIPADERLLDEDGDKPFVKLTLPFPEEGKRKIK